jgi:hypothetical protein
MPWSAPEPPAVCWLTGFLRTQDNQVLLLEYGGGTNPLPVLAGPAHTG